MVPVRLVEASCIVRGARGTRLRDARRRVRREFGPSATPTLAIGVGTGVHPRERSCVRPIYIWGAAASLEPGEATRVGTVALAGGGRRVCHRRSSHLRTC